MSVNTDLYDLIHALSPSEKAYFKKYAYKQGSGKDNPYLQLFDAIDRQKKYDEEKLKQKFKGQKFIKQFSTAKNYLYNLILGCLADYDASKSKHAKVLQAITQINSLYKRGLRTQANKRLQSALKVAEEQEFLMLQNMLLGIELTNNPVSSSKSGEYGKTVRLKLGLLNKLLARNQLMLLKTEMLKTVAETGINFRDEERMNKWLRFFEHPLMQGKEPLPELDFKTNFTRLHLQIACHKYTKNFETECETAQSLVAMFEEEPKFILLLPESYLLSLACLCQAQGNAERIDELEQTMAYFHKARQHKAFQHLEKKKPLLFYGIIDAAFFAYSNHRFTERAHALIAQIKNYHPLLAERKPLIMLDKYKFAQTYFIMGENEKALNELNEVLNDKDRESMPDNAMRCHILSMLVHFELNNLMLLEHALVNAQRYIRKKDFVSPNTRLLTKSLKQLFNSPDANGRKKICTALMNGLDFEAHDAYKLSLPFFKDWLESKLENKPLLHIVKRNAEHHFPDVAKVVK